LQRYCLLSWFSRSCLAFVFSNHNSFTQVIRLIHQVFNLHLKLLNLLLQSSNSHLLILQFATNVRYPFLWRLRWPMSRSLSWLNRILNLHDLIYFSALFFLSWLNSIHDLDNLVTEDLIWGLWLLSLYYWFILGCQTLLIKLCLRFDLTNRLFIIMKFASCSLWLYTSFIDFFNFFLELCQSVCEVIGYIRWI
jgi:hypothetical protein